MCIHIYIYMYLYLYKHLRQYTRYVWESQCSTLLISLSITGASGFAQYVGLMPGPAGKLLLVV